MRKGMVLSLAGLVVIVFLVVFFATDFFQDMGLPIPKNFEQCLKFGGRGEVLGDPRQGVGAGQQCVWMGIKFEGPLINY